MVNSITVFLILCSWLENQPFSGPGLEAGWNLRFDAPVNVQRIGYVALLKVPLTGELLGAIVENWRTRFDAVEQLRSDGKTLSAVAVRSPQDVVWEKDPQFRVLAGEQFAWVYFTAARRIIESDGLANPDGPALSLDVFSEIAECECVVSDRDDRTLDRWEKEGLM